MKTLILRTVWKSLPYIWVTKLRFGIKVLPLINQVLFTPVIILCNQLEVTNPVWLAHIFSISGKRLALVVYIYIWNFFMRLFSGLNNSATSEICFFWELHAIWLSKATEPFIQFSGSVVSDYLWPHGLQYTRLRCPSPNPGACSNSCSLCWWCHPTISSSVIPFSSCLQSFPCQGLFQWVSSLHQVAKYWSFSFNISTSDEYSRLISLRID